ncbi:hypothetical protein DSM106972_055380 [Dulcicalothrix desertica PCC 7102]|uniref:Uncharacterized protein n=1 Tax=Dulcicalothrix desertica PCC 7102 TaxID=232991 RepID=A0A3S1AKZ9_9CYAN|nr:hypothetical protein DSM106972_055380 [Dulcicalothrix desertica PCC 7102]
MNTLHLSWGSLKAAREYRRNNMNYDLSREYYTLCKISQNGEAPVNNKKTTKKKYNFTNIN